MFGKSKRPKDTMSVKDMTRLNKRPLKYVTMRDPETYKEVRLGDGGACRRAYEPVGHNGQGH